MSRRTAAAQIDRDKPRAVDPVEAAGISDWQTAAQAATFPQPAGPSPGLPHGPATVPLMPQPQGTGSPFPTSSDSPAYRDMLSWMLNQQRLPGMRFHLYTQWSDRQPLLESFDRMEDLMAAIRTKFGKPAFIFPFLGWAFRVTSDRQYLHTPHGFFPIHAPPSPDDAEFGSGWVGGESPTDEELALPEPTIPISQPIVAAATAPAGGLVDPDETPVLDG